ncbi:galactose oxidase [Annulohypoxylon maeteangense]|uniref:galactose oxidase n=1 Tax=Annulohypoxylon maeteangense TaxID=1927788 RepID=UPI002007FE42|nr:galactose oxidase [Annulohypoxylon maeteangense]KAI0886550.1 galactose oxidase [Annulohypoxylon maeteangense]
MKLYMVLSAITWATAVTVTPIKPANRPLGARWVNLPAVGGGAPVQEQGTAATDTHIYILGGIPSDSNNSWLAIPSTNRFETYSFQTKSWKSLPLIPKAFTHINAAAVNDKVYVLGGLTGDGVDQIWRSTPDCFVYDILNGTWTALPPMPTGQGRGASAVGISGNTVYLAGGMERLELTANGTQESLDIVTAYDTEKGAWTTLPSLPASRDHVGGVMINRTFYVVGGRDHGQPNVRNTTWTLYLNALEKGWVAKAEMPTARGGLAIGVIGDYIATFGGEGNPAPGSNGVFNETEVYDVKGDQWFKLPAMPHPRHGMVAASVHGRVYIPGGGIYIGAGPVDTFDAFELDY